jgi:ribA/ribD-fused uncharacterized protein
MSAGEAKNYGKKTDLREDWEEVKIKIMCEIAYCKFAQNQDLKEKLLKTGEEELIEGNHWRDQFWGVYNGEGKNWLGRILMKVRKKLSET